MMRMLTMLLSFALVLATAQRSPAVASEHPSEQASQRWSSGEKAEPPRSSEAERYEERILWYDEQHRHALFLPEAETASKSPAELSMKDYASRILENQLEVYRMPDRGRWCSPAATTAGQGAQKDAKNLEELVLSGEVVLLGEVVSGKRDRHPVRGRFHGDRGYSDVRRPARRLPDSIDRGSCSSRRKAVDVRSAVLL